MRRGEQVVQNRARRQRKRSWRKQSKATQSPRSSSTRLIRTGKVVGVVGALTLMAMLYKPIASSSIFNLEDIVVEGNTYFPTHRVEAIVRRSVNGSLLASDLTRLREALEQQPLIRDAIVTRILPHTLRLTLYERTPVAMVQSSGKLVAVDREGVIVGDFELVGDQPPLLGWADERKSTLSRSTNLERLRLYLEVKDVLNGPGRVYWEQIEAVDVRDPRDVVISLRASPATEIHLGDRDFRQRVERLLQELERRGIPLSRMRSGGGWELTYVDARVDPPEVVARQPTPQNATPHADRSR